MEGLDASMGPGASTPTNYQGAKNPQDAKYHPSRNFLIGTTPYTSQSREEERRGRAIG
jgi:hypothetical protein